jgi:hypothetical protein
MTRDDIIRLGREAGLLDKVDLSEDYFIPAQAALTEVRQFAALAAAAEREECAKVCEELQGSESDEEAWKYAAAAIRARGKV